MSHKIESVSIVIGKFGISNIGDMAQRIHLISQEWRTGWLYLGQRKAILYARPINHTKKITGGTSIGAIVNLLMGKRVDDHF